VAVGRLEVALEELLTNAVIHSDSASPTVAVTVSERSETVEVAVRDDGPHIPAREQEVLSHGSMVDELFHGTGLGLWVVYWIVKQSNGSVTVATREPAGNTVTVELRPATR
jgi:signal transduction histidine kinase